MEKENFIKIINNSFTFKGDSVLIGSAVLGEDYDLNHTQVKIPLKSFTRHGLIAGATGTGKTKSLQLITEELSLHGVPTMVMDIKGDLSGLGAKGTTNKIIEKRAKLIDMDWEGKTFPLEFLTLSDEPGAKMRATVSEYGPILLSKVLELNDNQTGILTLIFKFCDDLNLPLLDFKDLKSVITYITNEGKEDFKKSYGYVHPSSAGAIMRSIVSLEQQEANRFYGEPSFDIHDLMHRDSEGKGLINVLRLTDMQQKPQLFSSFMLCLLAELFQVLPEKGDVDKPELVIFIDEAHLIFRNASKTLLDQLEITVKLIRSKGVGVFFVTQSPNDIPAVILSQLGTKVQHALRAFTAKDRKDIKEASQNFPDTEFYKVDKVITELGIGEAFVSTLDEKGKPTELVHTLMRPPYSRMDVLTDQEIGDILNQSRLIEKYNTDIDRESAYEMLQEKIEKMHEHDNEEKEASASKEKKPSRSTRTEKSNFEKIMSSRLTNTIVRELTRGILGVLGISSRRRRR